VRSRRCRRWFGARHWDANRTGRTEVPRPRAPVPPQIVAEPMSRQVSGVASRSVAFYGDAPGADEHERTGPGIPFDSGHAVAGAGSVEAETGSVLDQPLTAVFEGHQLPVARRGAHR